MISDFIGAITKMDKKSYSLRISMYLQKYPDTIFSKICYDLKINNVVADRTLDMLKELEIVIEKKIRGSNARIFRLTEKGLRLTQKLNEIKRILDE